MQHEKRTCIAYIVFVSVMSLLLIRLYNLSKPEALDSMSALQGQYTGILNVCERDGFIYDRNGRIISHDIDNTIALVNPGECQNPLYYADKLSGVSSTVTASEIYEKILGGVPFTIVLKQGGNINLSGVYVFDTYQKRQNFANHFLGYSDIDGNGRMGLRFHYNDVLTKHMKAKVSASFDTNAKRMSLSGFEMESEKYQGNDGVVTTVDESLQMYCESLEQKVVSGAIMVFDMDTGEILALCSFPSFDEGDMQSVLRSDKGELVNRITSSFTPGSVFKIIMCLSALDNDEQNFGFTYNCTGEIEVDGNIFRCHKHSGHGEIDMAQAFAESCNTYFIALGQKIGMENIVKTMKKLELDEASEASFMSESGNCFIDEENANDGYLANISFGQGDLCMSVLDMSRVLSAASTGYLVPTSCVMGQVQDGLFERTNLCGKKRIFTESVIEKMLFMMRMCVEEGTGKGAKSEKINIYGKTATAQTGVLDEKGVEKVHKWFCGASKIKNVSTGVVVLCDFTTNDELSPSVVCRNIFEYMQENGK